MISFLFRRSHSCLNKNNFVMISICKKNNQLKATKVTAQRNHTDFRTRPEWKMGKKATEPLISWLFYVFFFHFFGFYFFWSSFFPSPSFQFMCTQSLAQEHLYVELWLNFIIQTIYFNVGGGDGAYSYSLALFNFFFFLFFIFSSIKVNISRCVFTKCATGKKETEVNWERQTMKKSENMRLIFLHFATQKHKCILFCKCVCVCVCVSFGVSFRLLIRIVLFWLSLPFTVTIWNIPIFNSLCKQSPPILSILSIPTACSFVAVVFFSSMVSCKSKLRYFKSEEREKNEYRKSEKCFWMWIFKEKVVIQRRNRPFFSLTPIFFLHFHCFRAFVCGKKMKKSREWNNKHAQSSRDITKIKIK